MVEAAHTMTLLNAVERHLAEPPKALPFEPKLEAMFQAEAAERRALSAYWAGWIAIIAFNLMLSTIYLTHGVGAAGATRVLIAAQAIVTLPSAAFLLAVRRRRDPKQREFMLLGGYGLVTLGAITLTQHMANEAALCFAFASALIPVIGNIVLPISFVGAAIGSVASVAALIVSALWRQRFSADAEIAMILLYGGGAAATLVANYRFESHERLNYLMRLCKTLRSDDCGRAGERVARPPRDFLSALPNRREFDERFTAAANWCRGENLVLSALFVDIDHFKLYNDRHGRLEGDKCLEAVAQAIVNSIEGSGGFAGRVGGEAFAVVLPGADHRGANAVAEQIRAAVLASRIPQLGFSERRFVTVSIGAATMNPKKPETTNSLLARADEALYRAKRGGRDRAEIERRAANS